MPRYQAKLEWTEDHAGQITFDVPEDMTPEEVLNEALPPLNNLKISDIELVSAGETLLN